MHFFRLKTTTERDIIGSEYPQIQTMAGTVHRDAADSLYNVYPDSFPKFIPNLNYFVLNNNAKLTDFLSAAMISFGFIVNDKVKSILDAHILPPHKYYPAIVEYHGKIHENYYWLFYQSNMLNYIDYSKTHFFISNLFGIKERDFNPPINSKSMLDSILEILPNDKSIDAEKIYFNKDLPKLDLIKISGFDFNTYISDKLFQSFKDNKITGHNVTETEKIAQ